MEGGPVLGPRRHCCHRHQNTNTEVLVLEGSLSTYYLADEQPTTYGEEGTILGPCRHCCRRLQNAEGGPSLLLALANNSALLWSLTMSKTHQHGSQGLRNTMSKPGPMLGGRLHNPLAFSYKLSQGLGFVVRGIPTYKRPP